MRTVDPVRHEAKRRHILNAAAVCFARKGFERTTVAEICAEAGISSGSLFHYFPTKRSVFVAIFEQDGRDNAERLALAAEADDPWQAVLDLVDSLAEPLAEPRMARLAIEVAAHASRDDDFAALLFHNDRELAAGLADLLRRAAAEGRIDGSVDPALAASWIVNLVDSLYGRASFTADFALEDEVAMLRLILTRFLLVEPRKD
ncbi:TetR/AcrR family transcriptional regulator [Streptoalloteichus hindustanus]|uniref:Transcriptional regulator, TetR family n=1 Tax=Streptoalloteichus hindustanus TaxID=2017 RepID=A0A1M5EL63_STRHI|nr:TetR/AcrR family transcriptional regulator [Streptoalloteichus hindustanus]SHF79870.1 transcriptional regulator, TetR family [Streptoalloteichus hindustanus]